MAEKIGTAEPADGQPAKRTSAGGRLPAFAGHCRVRPDQHKAGQMMDRRIIAVGFRDLAESFLRMVESPARNRLEVIHHAETIARAGKLTVAAAKAGYLKLPGLAKLVKWSEGPAPEMKGRKAVLHPGPENVFYAVSGNLLPAAYPDVFPCGPYLRQDFTVDPAEHEDFRRLFGKVQCEQLAKACRVLAKLVETDVKDPSDDLLDRLRDLLTRQQLKIVQCLREKKNGVGFDELASTRGAFRDVPDDEAIIKALNRIRSRLANEPVTIEVSPTKRRAKLVFLKDK
jgi:hypothetical protein